jgi:hypothetical protein
MVVVVVDGRVDVVVARVVVVVDDVVVVGGSIVWTHRKSAPQADPARHSRTARMGRRMGRRADDTGVLTAVGGITPTVREGRHRVVMSGYRTFRPILPWEG